MPKKTSDPSGDSSLRRQAERILSGQEASPSPPDSGPNVHKLLHELQVHQIELEMQNEELRQTRDSLEITLAQYTDLYDFSSVGYFTLDAEGKILRTNFAGANLLGIERSKLIGSDFRLFVPAQERRGWSDFFKQLLPTQTKMTRELSLETDRGRHHFWAEGLGDGGGRQCWLALMDITERKRTEELRHQIERVIHHDLRSPAVSAISLARVLRDETNLTEEQRLLLGIFEQAGQNMLDTLDSSLELYKIETGQYQNKPKFFDCLALVKKTIETITNKYQAFRGSLQLIESHPLQKTDSGSRCLGEPKLLRTALQNLLVNALEASPPGEAVTVEFASDKSCRIAIKNQGVVPREIRDGFFDKFVTMGKKTGTGIGTYSAMMMVKAQGGNVTMRTSDKENQTVVTVRLPIPPPAIQPDGLEIKSAECASSLAILLAEDDKVTQIYLTYLLEEEGHHVTVTSDGATALSILAGRQFDLILMDMEMPVMDGMEATRAIRTSAKRDAKMAGIPIIAMTGHVMAGDREKFLSAGMDDYIAKPVEMEALRQAIQRVLDKMTTN